MGEDAGYGVRFLSGEATLAEGMPRQFEILDEDERIIAGYASVEVLDSHGDIIPIEELERAMYSLMDRGGLILYGHSNKPVGKILRWEVRKHPEVDAKALWIVAKIFKSYPLDDEVWRLIKEGQLRGFSIGGQGVKEKRVLKDGADPSLPKEVNVVRNLNLLEISVVPTPANPLATIEAVNYLAKSADAGEKKPSLDEILEKYKVRKDIFDATEGCGTCFEIAQIIKDVGDVELGLRIWRAIHIEKEIKDVERLEREWEGLWQRIMALKDYERDVAEIRSEEAESLGSPWDGLYQKILEDLEYVKKALVDIAKPFGRWESFDDCVKDMQGKGYSEETSKRICGHLQNVLEKDDGVDEVLKGLTLDALFEKSDLPSMVPKERLRLNISKVKKQLKESDYVGAALEVLGFARDILVKGGEDNVPLVAVLDSYIDLVKKSGEIRKDKRPPRDWFYRCVARTGSPALCGWVFYHRLSPTKPAWKTDPDKPYTAEARARKRAWLRSAEE